MAPAVRDAGRRWVETYEPAWETGAMMVSSGPWTEASALVMGLVGARAATASRKSAAK